MKLCFDSIEEVKDFVKQLKGTRGGKAGDGDNEAGTQAGTSTGTAPALLQPPVGGGPAFNPGAPPFNPGPAFNPVAAPEVQAAVKAISDRVDLVLAAPPAGMGQDPVATLNWFRQQCGAEAANATMDQIKASFLPRLPLPSLQQIAKLIGVVGA